MLVYEVTLPEMPTGTDIAQQKLTTAYSTADGEHSEDQDLALDATIATIKVPDEMSVTLSLRYIDDAGNVSEPSTQTFMSHDTIPPHAPGAFGAITLVDEVPDVTP